MNNHIKYALPLLLFVLLLGIASPQLSWTVTRSQEAETASHADMVSTQGENVINPTASTSIYLPLVSMPGASFDTPATENPTTPDEPTTPDDPGTTDDTDVFDLTALDSAINLPPNSGGYPFENWGGDTYDDSEDLNAATLIEMFGAENTCVTGETGDDCVLKAAAREWRTKWLDLVKQGHCYGLAVTSQRFFTGLETPEDFRTAASNVFELDPEVDLRGHITRYAVTQALRPAKGRANWIYKKKNTPTEILELIRTRFEEEPDDPYVLMFYHQAGLGGHAVTPIGIEDMGNGTQRLYIYDNNYPGQANFMLFDTEAETWVYDGAALNPEESASAWWGDARTDSLALRPTSAHEPSSGWRCPYCGRGGGLVNAAASTQDEPDYIEVGLTGPAELLITDANGNSVGYDPVTGERVNEIEGAIDQPLAGGLGIDVPIYYIPAPEGDASLEQYDIQISVDPADPALDGPVDTDFYMVGMGAVNAIENLSVDVGDDVGGSVQADGLALSFEASGQTEEPVMMIAYDSPDSAEDSQLWRVSLFDLEADSAFNMGFDPASGDLSFSDQDESNSFYTIDGARITTEGEEQPFFAFAVQVPAGSEGELDLDTWDGETEMPATIDGETIELSNETVLLDQVDACLAY